MSEELERMRKHYLSVVDEILAKGAKQERERLRAVAVKRLPEMGVGPEFSQHGIHGWRCEYPDRYGPCECFDEAIKYVFDDPEDG